jgi:uncharacterized membrane protein
MTGPEVPDWPESTDEELERPLPSRPAAVELASAILIVGGIIGAIGTLGTRANLPAGTEPFVALTFALDIGAVILGLLVRRGRAWLLAVNYAAVLGFVDLLAAGSSPAALMLGLADIVVVIILFVHKAWFDELRERGADVSGRRLNP